MPPDFTPDVKDLISKMLVLDPHKRIKVCPLFSFFLFHFSLLSDVSFVKKKKDRLTHRWTT